MIRLTHISDTHGNFPKIAVPDAMGDIIIHSGDMMPNRTRGIISEEMMYQKLWMMQNISGLKRWIGSREFVYIPGNHDYFDPIPMMLEVGIKAHDITDCEKTIQGIRMYGFPHIPYIIGEWNYETPTEEMIKKVNTIPNKGIDILVAHCPPAGILSDFHGDKGGNTSLANWLAYNCLELPRFLMCGHFHGHHGISYYEPGMIISNAATTIHNFEY